MKNRRNYWHDYDYKFSCVIQVVARSELPYREFVISSHIAFSHKRITYKKNTLSLIGIAMSVVLLLFFRSPAEKHLAVPHGEFDRNITTVYACAACHPPSLQDPLKGPPPKEDCLR